MKKIKSLKSYSLFNYFQQITRALVILFLCIFTTGCDENKETEHNKKNADNAKPNVKYSTFEKDGKKYVSYDFGKAVFTVDGLDLNSLDDSSVEMRWFWPGLIPIAARGNTGEDTSKYSEVRILVDFSDVNHYKDGNDSRELWDKHICKSEVSQKNKIFWCDTEVQSDLPGFKKYGRELDKTRQFYLSTTYVADPDGAKSPQGKPVVLICEDKRYLRTQHKPVDLDCYTTFQYYQKISIAVLFRGDVVPQWQELISQVDTFFKTRIQEK